MSEKGTSVARTLAALRKSNAMAGSESVRYVALGDSVTAGWLEHGILDSDAAYPSLFRRRLASLYPMP
jgi:lysophospholipase L1-like esterase